MEEAEESADRIAIMDHGKIVSTGTVEELLRQTKQGSLEQAFLSLTGREIRDEDASGVDRLRMHQQMRGGR